MTPAHFYEYLESVAARIQEIGHSDTENHFFRGELEEFYRDLRNRVKFPAFIAESYELQYDNNIKTRESSFIIAMNYKEAKNWVSVYSALDACEIIGDKIIEKITEDTDNGLLCANFLPISATPLINEQHLYVGLRFTFHMNEPLL